MATYLYEGNIYEVFVFYILLASEFYINSGVPALCTSGQFMLITHIRQDQKGGVVQFRDVHEFL